MIVSKQSNQQSQSSNLILTQKINNQITAPELRVLDENEENLGVLKLAEALALAKQKGLDLIEISAGAKPPVARIISYDKYRYQQEKKLKKQKSQNKGGEQKQIQISIREAAHDLEMKAKRVNGFLDEGHRVELFLTMRGREKGNKDFGRKKLEEFTKLIQPGYQVVSPANYGGRGFTMIVVKKVA